MKIKISDQEILLHASGMAFLPEHHIGIVSDLHLEKGSHFAQRGFFLPPYDSQETLHRLSSICEERQITQLILLGDCFHDPKGYARLTESARILFDKLSLYNPIWIKGNHDKDFVPERFSAYEVFQIHGLVFRHQTTPEFDSDISGHFHPKIKIVHKGAVLQRDCFVEDGNKLILPAFGSYTGGLLVTEPAIQNLFGPQQPKYHILGESRIYTL